MAKTSIIFLIFLITACTPQISTTSTLITPSITHLPTYTETIIPTLLDTLTPRPSETPAPIHTYTTEPTSTPEPTPENIKPLSEITNLDHIPDKSVQCVDKRLCYHMDVKEEKQEEAWRQVISSFAVSPMLQDYWKDLGVSEPSPENVEAWLETSVGGPENSAYWLPAKSPNGIPFMMLQARDKVGGRFETHKQIKERGGVYLGSMGFVSFSVDDWINNEELNGWVSNLLEKNYRGNPKFIDKGSSCYLTDGDPHVIFGPNVYNNRFVFIVGHERNIEINPEWHDEIQLGGIGQEFRSDHDPKILQVYWDMYWLLTSKWEQSETNWEYLNKMFYPMYTPSYGNPEVNIENINETIFEPSE